MATFNKDLKNVSISLEDQANPNDEMLTVSFNQCAENETFSSDASHVSKGTELDSSDKVEQNESNTTELPKDDSPLASASQYFMDDKSPKRHRTTSDNEFFDHLVAGDTAMMCDENVGESVSNDILNTSAPAQNIRHCDSAAKLNVSDSNDENIIKTDEADSISTVETLGDILSQTAITMEKSDDVTEYVDNHGENDSNLEKQYEDQNVSTVAAEKEDLPVFRYFANDSASVTETASTFDSFSNITSDGNNVVQPDAFSAAIEESEMNRRRDAWIPSSATKEYFENYIEVSGTSRKSFTNPQLILKNMLTDPITALMVSNKIDGNACATRKANIPREDTVPDNDSGLKKLMEMGCHRAAINLTRKLILRSTDGSRLSPQLLQLWFCRLGLLIKVKLFNEAYEESLAFAPDLDKPDMYHKFYPDSYNGREGSMVPFGFRLLLAEIPRYVGKYQDALGRLYTLLNVVKNIIKNLENGLSEDGSIAAMSDSNREASQKLWSQRELSVIYSLVNAVSCHKDYSLAIRLMKTLIEKESNERKPHLYAAKGRLYLQLGDVHGAQESFSTASSNIPNDLKDNNEYITMELINNAMISVAQNNFQDAYKHYKEASEIEPSNPTLKNNMAVCLLYTGEMRKSLSTLEQDIKSDPANFLHEGVLFNVCTLYELESSHSTQKKANMLALTSLHKGDAFNTACLKIS